MARARLDRVRLWVVIAALALAGAFWGGSAHRLARAAPAGAGGQGRTPMVLPDGMKAYPSPYYIVYSDLPPEEVREVAVRMTKMAEEYHARTEGFSGVIRRQLPFYVFRNPGDYYAAGGPPGSAGVFMTRGPANAADSESRLMAIAVDRVMNKKSGGDKDDPDFKSDKGGGPGGRTWHVVQHEGFHQFAHAVIGGDLPPWVNEGLAEYFGESLFTGDQFVTGIIPPSRLARVQEKLKSGQFGSIQQMMTMTHREWNSSLNGNNYDQAWSMVHFLAHGEDGAYQKPFVAFMNELARGRRWEVAWLNNFRSAEGFEKHWKDWWLAQPANPTANEYARAAVATLTSFLARATMQKQTFTDFDSFLTAAKAHELKVSNDEWLPPALLDNAAEAVEASKDHVKWTIELDSSKAPRIAATLPDGSRVVGTFTRSGARVGKVLTDIDDLPVAIARAKELAAGNKKREAQAMLKAAIANHPKSTVLEQARKTMAEIR